MDVTELADRAIDHVMRVLDVAPSVIVVRGNDPSAVVLLAVADRLGVLYGRCLVHGAVLTGLALLDGREIQLGHVEDADDLAAAIVSSPQLDELDADRLLADLRAARAGP